MDIKHFEKLLISEDMFDHYRYHSWMMLELVSDNYFDKNTVVQN